MQPRSPILWRAAAAALFALSVAAVVDAQPPGGAVRSPAQPEKKDEKKDDKKEEKKIEWPTDVRGRDLPGTLKDIEDPDPVIREFGARNLPAFGPPASKERISKLLIRRMKIEKDPGVKSAVYAAVGGIQFENPNDNTEAMRLLLERIDAENDGSSMRLAAVQAVAMWGTKGNSAIATLTGKAINDPSYGTRQQIARALGQVGFNEDAGPNMRALTFLADKLARDDSAAVRMDALQSLLLLGPPWSGPKPKDAKTPPPTDTKSADVIIKFMRARVGDSKTKAPAMEKDKQVEIYARLVMMRFDPKEVNDENLDAITKYLTEADHGVKLQALQALGLLGEGASKKLSDVLRLLETKEIPTEVVASAVQVLGSFGAGAKPGLPDMKKFLELKKAELAAKEKELAAKKDDLKLITEVAQLKALVKLLEDAIDFVDKAKPLAGTTPTSPGGSPGEKKDLPKKP